MKIPTVAKMGSLLGTGCLIASLFNLVTKKASAEPPAKADSCIQYHEKALKALQFGEDKNAGGFTRGGKCTGDIPCAWVSGAVTAYSLLYQNCRDLEKRK